MNVICNFTYVASIIVIYIIAYLKSLLLMFNILSHYHERLQIAEFYENMVVKGEQNIIRFHLQLNRFHCFLINDY